jgi:hypothetical protein
MKNLLMLITLPFIIIGCGSSTGDDVHTVIDNSTKVTAIDTSYETIDNTGNLMVSLGYIGSSKINNINFSGNISSWKCSGRAGESSMIAYCEDEDFIDQTIDTINGEMIKTDSIGATLGSSSLEVKYSYGISNDGLTITLEYQGVGGSSDYHYLGRTDYYKLDNGIKKYGYLYHRTVPNKAWIVFFDYSKS